MSDIGIGLVLEGAKVNMDLAQIKDANDAVDVKLNTTKADAEKNLEAVLVTINKIDSVVTGRIDTWYGSISQAEKDTLQALQRGIGVIRQIYGLIKQALNAAGISIPPILNALISTAFQVATTLLSLAQANMSNPYTVALGVMALIGAGISLAAAIDSETKAQQIQAQLDATREPDFSNDTGYEATII